MRPLILIAAAFAVSSCTRPVQPPRVDLAQLLAGHVAGPPQACVTTFSNQNLRVIDSSTITYGTGRTIYVNHLPGECPSIGSYNTIIADLHGNQYCHGDRVRGLEPDAIIPGPWCILGDWVPYRKP
jgi:hypothetical protein